MSTTVKFEPTHEISYLQSEPPGAEPEIWLVALREDGTADDWTGLPIWRVNELGQWTHATRKFKHWPAGKLSVINLTKPKKIKKGHEPKHMPAGTVLTLTRQADGSWQGRCEFDGIACERKSNGLMGITSTLCRAWLKEAGIVTAKPNEADNG